MSDGGIFGDRVFSEIMGRIREGEELASVVPSLKEWSKRVEAAPATSLEVCGRCGGSLLVDLGSRSARCAAGCGWTGVALRRLP